MLIEDISQHSTELNQTYSNPPLGLMRVTPSHCRYLYVLEFPNGKRYFGLARDPEDRFRVHKRLAFHSSKRGPLYQAMRKYGRDGAVFRVLCVGPRDYIALLEIAVIAGFKTTDRRFGYNVSIGGNTSPMDDPEIRAKAKASCKVSAYTPKINLARAEALKTLIRITNEKENRCIPKTEAIPIGWRRGQHRGSMLL